MATSVGGGEIEGDRWVAEASCPDRVVAEGVACTDLRRWRGAKPHKQQRQHGSRNLSNRPITSFEAHLFPIRHEASKGQARQVGDAIQDKDRSTAVSIFFLKDAASGAETGCIVPRRDNSRNNGTAGGVGTDNMGALRVRDRRGKDRMNPLRATSFDHEA